MEIEYLKKLNNLVRNFDIPSSTNTKDKNICFIIALPRGGSTFLQQILISKANFAYISNLAAKFWKNPSLGIWLQNQLNIDNYLSNFVSKFGTTFGPLEPHEFGWFWKDKLNINDYERIIDPVSWNDIYNYLNKIISISNTSLILDSPYVSSNFFKFSYNFKNAKFIILERDIWSVCNSICNARLLKYGNLNSFYGSKPSNFSKIKKLKNPVEQVVKQVYELHKEIEQGLCNLDKNQYLKISIKDLRKNPNLISEKIINFVENDSQKIMRKNIKINSFPNRDNLSCFNKDHEVELLNLVENYF